MRILFSPEFKGHVFIGLNAEQPQLMDTKVCDTMALVDTLELQLGVHEENATGINRMVLYYKALLNYMKSHAGNILEPSFTLSALGTAERALSWRDNLILDQWDPKATMPSERLKVIAGVEE